MVFGALLSVSVSLFASVVSATPETKFEEVVDENVRRLKSGKGCARCDLTGAVLRGVILHKANLRQVVMRNADLRWAYLNEVDLHEADLTGSDLREAWLEKNNLSAINLSRSI